VGLCTACIKTNIQNAQGRPKVSPAQEPWKLAQIRVLLSFSQGSSLSSDKADDFYVPYRESSST